MGGVAKPSVKPGAREDPVVSPCCAPSGEPTRGERVVPASIGRGTGAMGSSVAIPDGAFRMGSPRGDGYAGDGEHPIHEVTVTSFEISPTTVTNHEFAAFCEATGHVTISERDGWSFVFGGLLPDDFPPTRGVAAAPWWRQVEGADWRHPDGPHSSIDDRLDHPVVHVSWFDAAAYCEWTGTRLPTEAEWEYAASWDAGEKRPYPWGAQAPGPDHANLECAGLAGVDNFPAGDAAAGCRQMIGNVWEWTASTFNPYPGFVIDPYKEYSEPWFGTHKVLRGGSFATTRRLIRNTWRNFYTPDRYDVFAGFRTCAAGE